MLSYAYFPVRFRAQQRTKCNSLQLTANCIAGIRCIDTISKWFMNPQPQRTQFPSSLTLLSFKTRIEWPPVLIATANFPSLLFQFLQYPRQRPSYSAHRAALMTKTVSIFPAFSSRFVDFPVQFCFRFKFSFHEERRSSQVWQWRDFLGAIKILLLRIAANEIASFVYTIDYVKCYFWRVS